MTGDREQALLVGRDESSALDDCCFYHTLELPTYGRVEGTWDLTGRYDEYTNGVDVAGKTVLDIGTASGFLTWEAEKRGGSVTSFDLDRAERLCMLPIRGSDRLVDPGAWRDKAEATLQGWRNAYRLAHRDLGSSAECRYGNVYDLSAGFGRFDVVLLGQLLVHLPDAISALAAASSVCAETIVVVEGNFPVDAPLASLCGRANRPDVPYAWYHYSHGWYREVLGMLGFRAITVTTAEYMCRQPDHAAAIELATIVGTR